MPLMLYDLGLAWRNLRHRAVETFIPILVVGLAIALSVSVIVLADATEEGIIQASDPFGVIVIGRAGGGQELILSSILLQGTPVGNMPYSIYEELASGDERVQLAVPLAFGDNIAGARIIGTDHNFFELRVDAASPPAFQITEGRLFEPGSEFEAVMGAEAAARLGLGIGDQFRATHGVGRGIAENLHDDVYTIVGILGRSYTAYDTAVYTAIESVWAVHDEQHGQERLEDDEAAEDADHEAEAATGANGNVSGPISLTDIAPEVGAATQTGEVTAVMVVPASIYGQSQIAQQFFLEPTLQAAFPGEELNELLLLLGQAQQVLNTVGYLVLLIAGLTVFLSMYSAILARQQSIAIMRSLGSSRLTVVRVIIFETLLVSLLGSILGRVLGYLGAVVLANAFSLQFSIPFPVRFLPEFELVLWAMAIGVGVLAGLIPALMAYRVDVVERLFPS